MSNDPKDWPRFDPAIKPSSSVITVDAAELTAVSVLMRAVLATLAQLHQSTGGAGQSWINNVSSACQSAILKVDIPLAEGDADEFRRKAMERVNSMLEPIRFENETKPQRN